MPKRKRDEEDENIDKISDRAVRIKASRLKILVDRGCSQLTAQLRLARGFDRQKMTRRIKAAGSDAAQLARLNAELEVLKTMEPSRTASEYLIKQMTKMKKVRENEAFGALYGGDTTAGAKTRTPKSAEEGNVLGRLFKAKVVADVLPDILKGIRDLLGVGKPGTTAAPESSNTRNDSVVVVSAAENEFGGFSDPENEDFADYNVRIAASSDADSEDDTQAQNHDRQDSMSITTDEDAISDDDVDDDDDDDKISLISSSASTHSDNPAVHKPHTPAHSHRRSTAKPNSSFLPSLMMTGYLSGSSDNEHEDKYNPDADLQPAQRQNRRGQRARQKIAEKKFGLKAKHLGQQNKHSSRPAGTAKWDAQRGAVLDSSRGDRGKVRVGSQLRGRAQRYIADRRAGATRSAATGGNEVPIDPSLRARRGGKEKEKEKEKAVHPSWEAARKRKLEMKTKINIGVNGGAGVGRKITFD